MEKAKFAEEQQPVRIISDNNKLYVFICLNGKRLYLYDYDFNDESFSEEYFEYDYNEFIVDSDKIDVKDLEKNSEKYLNYPLPPVDDLEQLRADVDYLLMISE